MKLASEHANNIWSQHWNNVFVVINVFRTQSVVVVVVVCFFVQYRRDTVRDRITLTFPLMNLESALVSPAV